MFLESKIKYLKFIYCLIMFSNVMKYNMFIFWKLYKRGIILNEKGGIIYFVILIFIKYVFI